MSKGNIPTTTADDPLTMFLHSAGESVGGINVHTACIKLVNANLLVSSEYC